MCGGGYNEIEKHPKSNYWDFWSSAKNGGFAVELVKGCSTMNCPFRCSAYGRKESIAILPEDYNECLSLIVPKGALMFGNGDVTSIYPIHKLKSHLVSRNQFNLRADIVSEEILKHLNDPIYMISKVILNVFSKADMIRANSIKSLNKYLFKLVQIPVAIGFDYMSIFSICKTDFLFRGIALGRGEYIDPNCFIKEIKDAFGIKLTLDIVENTPSNRAFIETIVRGNGYFDVNIRRCFNSKSARYVLRVSEKDIEVDWWGNRKIIPTNKCFVDFIEFMRTKPDCSECFPSWKAY